MFLLTITYYPTHGIYSSPNLAHKYHLNIYMYSSMNITLALIPSMTPSPYSTNISPTSSPTISMESPMNLSFVPSLNLALKYYTTISSNSSPTLSS